MANTTRQTGLPGCNPFALEGPIVAGSGHPAPNFRPGAFSPAAGDSGGEFQYCILTLASTTSLTDGQVYVIDKDFNAALATTTNALRGMDVGIGRVVQASVVAGTYYIWLQRNGRAPVQVAASALANTVMQTTATGGQLDAPSSPTATTKAIAGIELTAANGGAAGVVQAFVRRPAVYVTN